MNSTSSWLAVLAVVLAAATAIHAALTKDDVRGAIGWVGIAILSPFVGAVLYALAGVNRIRRSAVRGRRERRGGRRRSGWERVSAARAAEIAGPQFQSLKILGDQVASLPATDENTVDLLEGGDRAYAAMLAEIRAAKRSIAMQTYILDEGAAGSEFVEALQAAVKRGVAVRVLIDAIGARYSRPPITRRLHAAGIPFALFMGRFLPWRLPYANLRCHRKILIVDGTFGFTGGMNVRDEFADAYAASGHATALDTHFRFEGPVVAQLFRIFAGDWWFTTAERLRGRAWVQTRRGGSVGSAICRPIDSGPDEGIERTHNLILGALACAQKRVRICSPYFLPDTRLVAGLAVAARRGIEVDIVIPENSNLRLVDWAVTSQLDQVIVPGCRVWRLKGRFDHSKLMVVDGAWALIGSSNLDPRSLRLNFEADVEIMDPVSAGLIEEQIERRIAAARRETLPSLKALSLPVRLRNRLLWLASPYL